jgi:hypothetical protein
MGSQKHCLRQAKECDRLAAEAKLKSDREVLRSAAAMWRTLAAAYELFKGDAIIKFGELSRDLDKAKPVGRAGKTSTCAEVINSKAKALAEAGISTSAARRAEIRRAFSADRQSAGRPTS